MRVFKRTYKDKNGKKRQTPKWYVEFRDHNEIIRQSAAFVDKAATEELGRKLVKLVSCRVVREAPPPELQRWIEGLPPNLLKKLAKWDLLDGKRVAASKSLIDHLDDFKASLEARDNSPRHVKQVHSRAKRVIEGCGFRFWSEITPSKVMNYLHELRQDHRNDQGNVVRGSSAQTFNFYLQNTKQFCRWMVTDRRASENPLAHLKGLNVKTDRRHDRRALTVDECRLLLSKTAAGKTRRSMKGLERAMLYRLALETGLRANELYTLTRSSFDLESNPPTVTVRAAYSKHRRDDTLSLRPELAEALRQFLAKEHPDAQAFNMPKSNEIAKMFKADLKVAGILYRDGADRVVDFHALRHTFISNLAASGVHPKVAQTLARHSSISLTMDRYTHTLREQELDALAKLPDLTTAPATQAAKATGTDDRVAGTDCPSHCLSLPVSEGVSMGCDGLKSDPGEKGESPQNPCESGGSEDKRTIRPGGLEPPTCGLGNRRSVLLSYGRKLRVHCTPGGCGVQESSFTSIRSA